MWVQGAQALGPSPATVPGALVGCWLEVEQLGLKPAFIFEAGIAGGGFTYCAIMLCPTSNLLSGEYSSFFHV